MDNTCLVRSIGLETLPSRRWHHLASPRPNQHLSEIGTAHLFSQQRRCEFQWANQSLRRKHEVPGYDDACAPKDGDVHRCGIQMQATIEARALRWQRRVRYTSCDTAGLSNPNFARLFLRVLIPRLATSSRRSNWNLSEDKFQTTTTCI